MQEKPEEGKSPALAGCAANISAASANPPEYVQQFNPSSLPTLLARHVDQVRIVSSFPWLIAVAR